ncbi:MAG: hypothetical protein ACRC1H_11085 [Caldilineaceae bacterium]
MKGKIGRQVAYLAVVVALMLLVVQVAQGGDLLGTGPDYAMSPSQDWVSIEPGQYQWYTFKYKFEEKNGPMEIRLEATPADAARFTVRNGDQANLWRRDGTQACFGRCAGTTRDANKDGKPDFRTWSGKMGETGTFYVVVERAAGVTGPISYMLKLSGDGMSLTGAAQPGAAATSAAEPAAVAVEAPVVAAAEPVAAAAAPDVALADGPDVALPMPTGVQTWTPTQVVEKGQYTWYYFDYKRDSKTAVENLRPIEIKIFSDPADVAHFTVRNGDDARLWRQDGTQHSFGSCSCVADDKNKDGKPDYAVWKGALAATGRYYVVVEHARNATAPATYRFEVSGM